MTKQQIKNSTTVNQSSSIKKMSPYTLHTYTILATFLLLLSIGQQIRASGVFELEFVKLQQLVDSLRGPERGLATETQNKIEQQQQVNNEQDPTNLIRVLVCLKEAFTSQLDGPCTFGNASIILNRDSMQQTDLAPASYSFTTSASTSNSKDHRHHQDHSSGKQVASAQQQQQGSLLTNIVRILFTFRWTKSFTIILTAEQLHSETDNQQQQIQRQAAQLVALSHGATTNGSTTNLVDLSTSVNNRSTREPTNQLHPTAIGSTIIKPQFIDRHVLTENEVLPNLEPNPNKPWANRFSRSLKSSLAYRFRVYCSLNYYGDGCTVFCRARDDQFGHYNCSSTGQKVCLDGWLGPDCDKAKCRAGCNLQNGYCDKPDTCQCRPGWTGPRCDECIVHPGCQNGYCISPWQCLCQRNWGGQLCNQDLNLCGTHQPCKNNGTCQNNAPGEYKCDCPDGFSGVDCGINLKMLPGTGSLSQLSAGCAMNPCLNGGTCYGFKNQLIDSGVVGQADGLESQADSDHESDERFYRCSCLPGWTGDYCQWSDSTSKSVTNLLPINVTSEKPTGSSNITDSITIFTNDNSISEFQRSETMDRIPPLFTTLIENSQPTPSHVDMRHLISGVVIASIVGVFLASLLLAWCCLMAIERNRFSFIQMNIIRSTEGESSLGQPIVSSTLRRVHEKIRDSLRRPSRNRIKPETKLSLENVLRPPKPPPSYEESSNYHINKILIEYPTINQMIVDTAHQDERITQKSVTTKENLVTKGTLEQKLASSILPSKNVSSNSANLINNAQLSCPRHGHLYRQRKCVEQEAPSIDNNSNKPTPSMRQDPTHFHHVSHLYHL